MKNIFTRWLACLFVLSLRVNAEGVLPYDELVKMTTLTYKVEKNGEKFAVFYLKSKVGANLDVAEFSMRSQPDLMKVLQTQKLTAIAIDKLSIEDINKIEGGYTHRLLLPLDVKKYKGWTVENDQPKGSLHLGYGVGLSSLSVEKKREEYRAKLATQKE